MSDQPNGPPTDAEIEDAIRAASGAHYWCGSWRVGNDPSFGAIQQAADAADNRLRELFRRARQPASSALVEALDSLALDAGLLLEADYSREQVCDENAVEVVGRIRESLTNYRGDSHTLTELLGHIAGKIGDQNDDDESLFDYLDRFAERSRPADDRDSDADVASVTIDNLRRQNVELGKTIADMRKRAEGDSSQISYLLETLWPICDETGTIRDAVSARQIPLYIDGMRQRARKAEDRAEKAEAEVERLREKVAGLQSQVDGMADDYQNCAKACSDEEMRAEKAEARVAEMEAKAKPEPSWDERLGPWALRDYLECYKPFDRTPIESAVAELCRRALREEADRG